jgi:hypothetical protein
VPEWAVEILNSVVEAELLFLPKDMQARFLRIAELLESFGPQRVGLPHVRPVGEKLWEMRFNGPGWNRPRHLYGGRRQAIGRTACVCQENAKDPARRDRLGA